MPEFPKSSVEHSSLYTAICNANSYNESRKGFFSEKAYVKCDSKSNQWSMEKLGLWDRVVRFFHVAHTDTLLNTLKSHVSNLTNMEKQDLTELANTLPFSNLSIVKTLRSTSNEHANNKVASIQKMTGFSSHELDKLLEEAQFNPSILEARNSTRKTIVAIALEQKKDLSVFVQNHREKLIGALKLADQSGADGFSKIVPDIFGYEFAKSLVKESCDYETLRLICKNFLTQIKSMQGSEYSWKLIRDILENQNTETVRVLFFMNNLHSFQDQKKNNFLHLVAMYSPDWKELAVDFLGRIPKLLKAENSQGNSAFKMLWEKDSSLDFRKEIVDKAVRHNFEKVLQEHIVLKVEEICRNFNYASHGEDIGNLLAYLKNGIHEEDRKIADVWSNDKAVAVLVSHPAFRKVVEARSKARAEAQAKAQTNPSAGSQRPQQHEQQKSQHYGQQKPQHHRQQKSQHHGQWWEQFTKGWKHPGQEWTYPRQGQQQYGWYSSSNQQPKASSEKSKAESESKVSPEAASTYENEALQMAVEHAQRGFNFLRELGYADEKGNPINEENDPKKLAAFLRNVMLQNHPDKVATRNAEKFQIANTFNSFIKNEVYFEYLTTYKNQLKLLEQQKHHENFWNRWG